jgi:glycerol-1-phosphatase
VLYLGPQPIAHAASSVAASRSVGMRAAYVTNNASRRPAVVAAHLTELGIPAEPEDVVTGGQAAVRVLVARLPAGSTVLVLGTDALAEEVTAAGLRPVRSADDGPVAVVQGLAPETGWADLAEAAVALRAGALWVAGNADSTYPSPRGPLPGNGAMVAALTAATGLTPLVAGKPEPALHQESVARVGALRPLVLTGVVDRAALLAAPAGSRPTYVSADLRGLLRPQLPVRLDGRSATCGSAVARLVEGGVDVDGEGDEALRAACALSWSAADRQAEHDS